MDAFFDPNLNSGLVQLQSFDDSSNVDLISTLYSNPTIGSRFAYSNGSYANTNGGFTPIPSQNHNIEPQKKKPRLELSHQLSGLLQQHMNEASSHKSSQRQSRKTANDRSAITTMTMMNGDQANQRAMVRGLNDVPQLSETVCTRRLMQYIYHLRRRPADNNIAYWRKIVTEYFAPGAKKRWCVAMYDKVGSEASSLVRNSVMSVWQCDMCNCRAGRGFESIFASLPRLTRLMYESGVIDELLFLDLPSSYLLPSGLMMLRYEKVSQDSIYKNFRVVHEGQLCVVFTRDLKILSWEFCARGHEVFVSRNSVMSQMARAEQNYQQIIDECGSMGVQLYQGSQAVRNRIQNVGVSIENALDLASVDDLGFSKRYARALQIAQVAQSMNVVQSFSEANRTGPIESLKHLYPELGSPKLQRREIPKILPKPQDHLPESFVASSEGDTSTLLSHNNTNNAVLQARPRTLNGGPSSSSRRLDQSKEHRAIQKIIQEMISSGGGEEPEKQVLSGPARMYDLGGDLLWGSMDDQL